MRNHRRLLFLCSLLSLIVTLAAPQAIAQATRADLQPEISLPLDISPDGSFRVAASIANLGPDTANDGRLLVSLELTTFTVFGIEDGLAQSASSSRGVEFVLTRPLPAGESREVTVALTPLIDEGQITTSARVYGSTDPIADNNLRRAYMSVGTAEDGCPMRAAHRGVEGPEAPFLRHLRATVRAASIVSADFQTVYRLRDEILSRSPAGKRYTSLYYGHGPEISRVLLANPAAGLRFLSGVEAWLPNLRALVERRGSSARITQSQIDALSTVLDDLKRLSNSELAAVIAREQAALDLPSLAGRTMDEALARQSQTIPRTITLTAAASLHGVPPTFFHSDVSVLNPSRTTNATVTARYRCFTSACGNATQTFTLTPGEMRLIEDAPVTLFGAAESGGAVELEGDVIVDSRLYTPTKPAPTTGMYVPGASRAAAFSELVLLSLAQSAAFRTNIGIYNPSSEEQSISVTLFDTGGRELGRVTQTIPAQKPVQINNVFSAAGVTTTVDNAYAVIRSDGVHELFAYASVIDNLSQDAIFVRGANSRGREASRTTLPAAASLHGVPPAFFHSDVRVFNPSFTNTVSVHARYRCSIGACASADRDFTVRPREMAVFDDIVGNFFGLPETGGAIDFEGGVIVDSRLYTPSRPAPTTGMYVPAQPETEAIPEAALMSLSHSTNPTRGFRTNAAVYNPNDFELPVTFTLYGPNGAAIGSLARTVQPRTSEQINSIFAAAGISTDVPSAYCIVRGDGFLTFFAYASVIDNQSGDLIFVQGAAIAP